MQLSFAEQELAKRLGENQPLLKVEKLINWARLEKRLKGLYRMDKDDQGGQRPYNRLSMLKAILLGQWHSLSDRDLEQALRVRLDFIVFCGFGLDETPDASTLGRFRNGLMVHKKLDGILHDINGQLQDHGLMMEKAQAAIVDATLITSAARPRKSIVLEQDNEGKMISHEDGSQPGVVQEQDSVDPDATWVKKGKKSYFGYRAYAVTDQEGYIKGAHVAPAHQSEMRHLESALDAAKVNSDNTHRVLTDKGSASKANRQMIKNKQIRCGIMYRAAKNRPLTHWQKLANRLIGKQRYRVEQFFGTLKRKFGFTRSRYMTTAKVRAQFILKGICANLLKAANKIKLRIPTDSQVVPIF